MTTIENVKTRNLSSALSAAAFQLRKSGHSELARVVEETANAYLYAAVSDSWRGVRRYEQHFSIATEQATTMAKNLSREVVERRERAREWWR